MFVDWDLLVRDAETGKAVWSVQGVRNGNPQWTAIIVREIDPTIARIVSFKNAKKSHARQLLEHLSSNGFKRVFSHRKGRIKWYFVPKKAQIELDLEGIT